MQCDSQCYSKCHKFIPQIIPDEEISVHEIHPFMRASLPNQDLLELTDDVNLILGCLFIAIGLLFIFIIALVRMPGTKQNQINRQL